MSKQPPSSARKVALAPSWSRVIAVAWVFVLGLGFSASAQAQTFDDTDGDGLSDRLELEVFHTDLNKADSDGDGYLDRAEIVVGYSPLGLGRLIDKDADKDGLVDRLELLFETDPLTIDTDGDQVSDGKEVVRGISPTSTSALLLQRSVYVNLAKQEVSRRVMGISISTYRMSSGLPRTPTPAGTFKILQKHPRAWSNSAKLWMPYWMHFSGRGHGFHELPEWPGGKKEGASHIGKPASHGCIRLGVGPAKELYEWTTVGMPVTIVSR